MRRPTGAPKSGGPVLTSLQRNLSGDRVTVDEALEAIRAGIANTSQARARERIVEHEAAGREAEQLRQQRTQMRQQAVPAHD